MQSVSAKHAYLLSNSADLVNPVVPPLIMKWLSTLVPRHSNYMQREESLASFAQGSCSADSGSAVVTGPAPPVRPVRFWPDHVFSSELQHMGGGLLCDCHVHTHDRSR